MIDVFDIFAFVVFAVLILAVAGIVIGLGSLPGWIASKRNHPQAAAVNIAGWLGMAGFGIFWPFALIWAFMNSPAPASSTPSPDGADELAKMKMRMAAMEAALRELNDGKGPS